MNAGRRLQPGTARLLISSFAAGLVAGAVFWLLHVPSPAPPWLGLTGLLGIVIGETAGRRLRPRRHNSGKTSET
jgi:XapX domain-containing protein